MVEVGGDYEAYRIAVGVFVHYGFESTGYGAVSSRRREITTQETRRIRAGPSIGVEVRAWYSRFDFAEFHVECGANDKNAPPGQSHGANIPLHAVPLRLARRQEIPDMLLRRGGAMSEQGA